MTAPSIEGTYHLVRRALPDGTVQHPPLLKGMITFTKGFRNFSIVWKDGNGKYYSECYVARYKLTDKEYEETSEYVIVDDQIGGKGVTYDLSNNTVKSAVSVNGKRISFAMPHPFEKALSIEVEFEGSKMNATGEGLFIDYWEKVA